MARKELCLGAVRAPVHVVNTLIVGSGAAGMACAAHLHGFLVQRGVKDAARRIAVVTRGLGLGASRMSGSDKQTYYKMGTSPRVPDTALDFARTLTAFGCMHGDLALAEGNCSLREFYHLVAAGVPFPHDPEGAFLGYKTDHDPYERATSAGPKTSRFMSQRLQALVDRAGIPIFDRMEVARLLPVEEAGGRRIAGLLALDARRLSRRGFGLTLFLAENLVLAAGGPGALYRTTVYPRGQVGLHGPAFLAGLEAHNLTESQYGLASIQFRWNVSGTYMQAVPRIFSTAADGKSEPREFLAEYFPNLERMAACIFLKGYQWPFDAQRIQDHQSSLVDLAVHRETVQRGRRVWMDFLRNPAGRPEWGRFSLERLEPEALTYLRRTGALQERPIERLAHMNPPAVEIYAENGIDLRREPLEIAVCAQHHNGGFVVNKWWESSLPHTFVIGEMAGTHGVKRPGGAALNSGQVGALRAAQFIAHVHGPSFPSSKASILRAVAAQARELLERLSGWLKSGSGARTPAEELEELTGRMTREGAHLRNCAAIARAVGEAREQQRRIAARGLRVARPSGLPEALHAESLALTQLAFLRAIEDLILARGGGSRGSHVVLDANGIPLPDCLRDPASGEVPRRRPENEDLRRVIQVLRYRPSAQDSFEISYAPVRPIPERDVAFEPAWTAYREQRIFQETDGA